MDSMTMTATNAPAPEERAAAQENAAFRAAVNGLAVVGFIALLVVGIALAIYGARFLPKSVSKLGTAGVYFSSLFTGHGALTVVPQTVSFDQSGLVASSTASTTRAAAATSTPATKPATTPVTTAPGTVPGPETVISTGTTRPPLSGLPDLAVTSAIPGYLTSNSTDSFVASSSVPQGDKPAVKFFVSNVGTNLAQAWTFTADLPAEPAFTYTAPTQQALMPGDRVQYVLGFDRSTPGTGTATITLDSANQVVESNERNNTATVSITVQQ